MCRPSLGWKVHMQYLQKQDRSDPVSESVFGKLRSAIAGYFLQHCN